MVSMLWYAFGAATLLLIAYLGGRRFETNDARAAFILRLAPWAVFFFWPGHASDLGGFALEGAALCAVLIGANWYAKVYFHDADRATGGIPRKRSSEKRGMF